MFNELNDDELTLFEDMMRSAHEKTLELYGTTSGLVGDLDRTHLHVSITLIEREWQEMNAA